MQASAVQGGNPSPLPVNTPAIEPAVMPSTSFRKSRALQIVLSSNCFGRGRKIRTPWISWSSLYAAIFARSLVIGKPVTVMALDRHATVTICHSRTTPEVLREAGKNADVLITAVGRANFLTRDLTGEDQIILDVGINDDGAGGICGDVDPQAASAAAAASPVPGGVGSVTTAVLMDHVVTAAARSALQEK